MPPVIAFAPMETPIGRLWLAGGPDRLLAVVRSPGADVVVREVARRRGVPAELDPDALSEPMRQLAAYLTGARRSFDLALDLDGLSTFDATVYRSVTRIPHGQTASYGEVAAMAGSPRAARAVGGAMARCSLSPVVPCHRVIHADGSLGGWGPDPWVKRWLLDLERATATA